MKVGFKSKSAERNCESGFSLIEVAIGLLIISVLMTPIIYMYNIHLEVKRKAITEGTIDMVRGAVLKYYERNGFYPNPATPSIAQGVAAFGSPAVIPGTGWPACSAASTVVCRAPNSGTFGVSGTGVPPTPATDGVLIGSVPIAALGLPYKSMIDGYGNRLTYAVSQNLTIAGSFLDSRGSINILNEAGANNQAHFVIVSHGKSGMGAFSLGGVRGSACNIATAPIPSDSENCDNDGVYRNNYNLGGDIQIFEGAGTTFFDDISTFINTTAYGIWSYIPNSSLNMQSRNTGNIKIGCPTAGACKPTSKLDVNGNVRANEVQTSRICPSGMSRCITTPLASQVPLTAPSTDASGIPSWFSPAMFTSAPTSVTAAMTGTFNTSTSGYRGSGLKCYGEPTGGIDTFALRGIASYDELCAGRGATSPQLPATGITINNCGPGLFANGITITATGFRFDCIPPP